MTDPSVTQLLRAWSGGDEKALGELTPKVYAELRRMAGRYMRNEGPGQTLQTTALVHEVFLKLVDADRVGWKDRAHFFAVCATMMRRILVDRARARGAAKKGGRNGASAKPAPAKATPAKRKIRTPDAALHAGK